MYFMICLKLVNNLALLDEVEQNIVICHQWRAVQLFVEAEVTDK